MSDIAPWAFWATLWVAATMAPRLSRSPGAASRCHWMMRKGSRASSGNATIRLIKLIPNRCFPITILSRPVAATARNAVGSAGRRGYTIFDQSRRVR